MPDLHGWITQQIDKVQATACDATGGEWFAEHPEERWGEQKDAAVLGGGKPLASLRYDHNGHLNADHMALHSPAAVLRRCAADRKILERHRLNPHAYWADAAMCDGCGTEGEMAYAVTENLNDCPELLDLAEAHGLTPEILAGLDRPQEGERPEPSGPSLIPDSIAEVFAAGLLRAMTTQIIAANTPSPKEKALRILEPDLKKISVYVPFAEEPGPM